MNKTNNQSIHKSTNTERKKVTNKQIRSNQLINRPNGPTNRPTN